MNVNKGLKRTYAAFLRIAQTTNHVRVAQIADLTSQSRNIIGRYLHELRRRGAVERDGKFWRPRNGR